MGESIAEHALVIGGCINSLSHTLSLKYQFLGTHSFSSIELITKRVLVFIW